MDIVCALHDLRHFFFHLADGIAFLSRIAQELYFLSEVIILLHGGERDDDGRFRTSLHGNVARGHAHADNLIVDAVDFDRLPARISAAGKQSLINTLPDDAHPPPFPHVHVVQVASVRNQRLFDLPVFWIQSFERAVDAPFLINDVYSPPGLARRDDLHFAHTAAYALHIGIFQVPGTALLETFIGFPCLVRTDEAGIGGKAFKLAREHLLHALRPAHEGYQHEDAPKDAEGGQQAARLVPREGHEDFFPNV